MAKDNTNKAAIESLDRKVLLSTMWIFAMFNYLYADVIGLMDHTLLTQMLAGTVGAVVPRRSLLPLELQALMGSSFCGLRPELLTLRKSKH